jgi:glycine dehydrogenase subunit 1
LVGETVYVEGHRAYVTTLRAREQDIRREKATSNVCTNQTLMAVTAAIQLGWLGTSGLTEMARRCAQATRYTREAVLALDRVEAYADAPVLREFALRLPVPAELVVERMADAGFLAGVPLGNGFDDGEHGLLVSVTERRTREEIDAYVTALAKAVR